MGQEDEKLIEEIRDFLMNHEEPYEEGNWEVFCEKYKKEEPKEIKKDIYPFGRIWKYTSVAAAIIFMMLMFPLYKAQIGDKEPVMVEGFPVSRIEKQNIVAGDTDRQNIKKENKQNDKADLSPLTDKDISYEGIKETPPILVKSLDKKELVKDWERPMLENVLPIKRINLMDWPFFP